MFDVLQPLSFRACESRVLKKKKHLRTVQCDL